ncbi:MAG: tetratricopeptide repeat protein [Terriglobales bacterium]
MPRSQYQKGALHQLQPEQVSARLIAAASTGNPHAQHMVGLMFMNGTGLEQDHCKGAAWIQKAAQQGLPRAQNDLAALYAEGRGLRRNLQQALFWLRCAADQGLPVARENLKRFCEHSIPLPPLDSSAAPPLPH